MRAGGGSKGSSARQWSAEELSQLPMDLPNVYAAAFAGYLIRLDSDVRPDVELLIAVGT
jgi:hypothetical protein